ncbi:MAG: amidotransferase [Bacteroidales bacterium]|nr:amidotransferase [Bacteroidales bacterium]
MQLLKTIFLSFIILFLFTNCNNVTQDKNLIIAISKAKPDKYYGNYPKWIYKADPKVEIINMYELGVDSALQILNQCDGLLVTGGADVYPGWYGKIADTARCGTFDLYRDTLEMELLRKAIDMKIPIVGICRGEQILNVTLGGSLIIDIPSDHDTIIKHRQDDWKNCFHQTDIIATSLLQKVCQVNDGSVNSNHHQAIDVLAEDLSISSYAEDQIIESVEWKDPLNKSFLIAVQWHPERLDSVNSSLSLPIVREFIMQARKYQSSK